MKVYIECRENGYPRSKNSYDAYLGFREMGFEIQFYNTWYDLESAKKEDIVVGFVEVIEQRLRQLGIEIPTLDYPDELQNYLGRRIWRDKINRIAATPELWPVFVKSVENKRFTGAIIRSPKDLIGAGVPGENPEVICSEILDIKAEWRVFVRYGEILDVRPYKGDWRYAFDPNVIEDAVKQYISAPNGYAIDFGRTKDGRTVLIEVNDGYALGDYGLQSLQYAKLLSARWAELTGTEDECRF